MRKRLVLPPPGGVACSARRLLGAIRFDTTLDAGDLRWSCSSGHPDHCDSVAAILIALIALVDWHFEDNVSFGFLYLFPMLMVGGCLTRWQIAGVAALCTGLTEAFDLFPWAMPVGISRIILTFAAFFGAGYYGFGAARSRRLANQHLGEIQREVELRRKTEEQLEFLRIPGHVNKRSGKL